MVHAQWIWKVSRLGLAGWEGGPLGQAELSSGRSAISSHHHHPTCAERSWLQACGAPLLKAVLWALSLCMRLAGRAGKLTSSECNPELMINRSCRINILVSLCLRWSNSEAPSTLSPRGLRVIQLRMPIAITCSLTRPLLNYFPSLSHLCPPYWCFSGWLLKWTTVDSGMTQVWTEQVHL